MGPPPVSAILCSTLHCTEQLCLVVIHPGPANAMKRASHQNDEVLCETFFSHAGFLSCPLRANTRSKHYATLALSYHNVKKVHIDENWIPLECLHHTKHKLWDASLGHLELINFEIAKEAEDDRLEPPQSLTMADLDMPLTNAEDDKISDLVVGMPCELMSLGFLGLHLRWY
jgi:hypothetical protein